MSTNTHHSNNSHHMEPGDDHAVPQQGLPGGHDEASEDWSVS